MAVRRGTRLVLVLIALAVLVSAAMTALAYLTVGRVHRVSANSALVVDVDGDLDEIPPLGVFGQLLYDRATVRSVVELIRRAKTDARIKGLVVRPRGSGPYWAKSQEIRDAITDFRTSGKKAVAFLEYGGEQEYFVATACDEVYLLPTSTLDLRGLATYEIFLRSALDKIGTYPDMLHVGDYKSAINTYTEKTFTPAHREMTESLNREAFEQLVEAVAAGRAKSPDEVRAIVDEGPFLPGDALDAGLVDDLIYGDEVVDRAGFGEDVEELDASDYSRTSAAAFPALGRPRVALIYAVGEIDSGTSGDGFDGRVLGSDTLADDIEQAREDDAVKAVVIRIDSPGGSSVASDVLWRELELTRDAKPLVASMSDLAASGGYFIAIPAHVIVAQPGTLTGSIGVFAGKLVPGGTLEKLGINVESVSIGRFSDIESPVRPFSKAERAKMQEQLQDFYDTFLERVAEARGKTPDEIHEVAQGRVWTGRQAKEVGLVDELGGLDVALRIAKERAGLKADQDVDLVIYPRRKGFSDLLANPWPQFESRLRTAALSWILLPDEQRALNALTHPFRRFRRGEPLALMPYVFVR